MSHVGCLSCLACTNLLFRPLTERPGRIGNWDYFNTDGLGLLEFLEWCEDMDMEAVLAVYAGYSISLSVYAPGQSYPPDAMPGVLQEALDMLEYVTGNTSTYWGAKRAQHGHPEPFTLKSVSPVSIWKTLS